ncbi:MAG: transketolase, partial [Gammaproteobacteria bacterium]|nr:transketolase [Gammaproteobacteria bacterium]
SRQKLAHMQRTSEQIENIKRGAYVLLDCEDDPEVIVIATGSEVELTMSTANKLNQDGHKIRVVSMPATDLFDTQDQSYRDSVLPPSCRKRISVEAGITDYWRKYVGLDGSMLGVDNFGESAPANEVFEYFGLTATKLEESIIDLEKQNQADS